MKEAAAKEKGDGDDDDDAVANEEEDSQFFNMASKAMKRLTSREDNSASSGLLEPAKSNSVPAKKVFKSPSKSSMPLQMLTGNQRGSFLSRNSATLDKLAALTKGKSDSRSGSGAKNTNKFVFSSISPSKSSSESNAANAEGGDSGDQAPTLRSQKRKSAPTDKSVKKARVDRTLDENSRDTIFGHL